MGKRILAFSTPVIQASIININWLFRCTNLRRNSQLTAPCLTQQHGNSYVAPYSRYLPDLFLLRRLLMPVKARHRWGQAGQQLCPPSEVLPPKPLGETPGNIKALTSVPTGHSSPDRIPSVNRPPFSRDCILSLKATPEIVSLWLQKT